MKRIIRIPAFIVFFIFLCGNSYAQERYGIANSLYAGENGIWLNPASMVNSPFKWDLNILTVHVYADNNYLFLSDANIPKLYKDNGKTQVFVNNHANDQISGIMLYERDNNYRRTVHVNGMVQGPSLMVSFKKWSFAFHLAERFGVSLTGLKKEPAKLFYEGLSYEALQKVDINVPSFRLNSMVWSEIGLSAGRILKNKDNKIIKAGITYKYNIGSLGAYFLNKSSQIYVPSDTSIILNNVNADYGYAMNSGNILSTVGSGHGIDLGISIEKKVVKHDYKCPDFCDKKRNVYYAWKLGASLLDFGYIKFDNSANTYEIRNGHAEWLNLNEMKADDFASFDTSISTHFYNSPSPAPISNTFKSWLPTALSIQADYNLGYNFFINGTIVQRIPHFNAPGLDRANSLAITPRFDHRRFGLAVPIVLYGYVNPRVGLAIRLNNNIIVGTDNLGSFTGHNLTGTDIYFSLKVNMLKKCKKVKGKKEFNPGRKKSHSQKTVR